MSSAYGEWRRPVIVLVHRVDLLSAQNAVEPIAAGRATPRAITASHERIHKYRIVRADRLGSLGALVIGFAAPVAVFGPWLMPHDPSSS
jgi:hypothetical protein